MPDRKKRDQLRTDGGIHPKLFVIRSEEAERLRKVIQKLPPQYRIVLVLRDMEGLTDEEVAEITGLRPGTMRVRLHRARLVLQKELMKGWTPRRGKAGVASRASFHQQAGHEQPRRARCKAMLAKLSDYLDGKLEDSISEKLEQHMNACQPCQAFLASLKTTVEQCRRSSPVGLDRKKAARLRLKVLADYKYMVAGSVRW